MIKYILLFTLFMSTLFASIGKISAITGDATVQRNNAIVVATLGMNLLEKDIIQTKANAKLQIIFEDKTIITIGKNSSLDIAEYLFDMKTPENSKAQFNFFKGAFKTVTGTIGKLNKKKFKLKTKSSTIGIRGTVIIGNQEVIACTQGGISVTSNGVTVDVDANELTQTNEGEPPSEPTPITNEAMDNLQDAFTPTEDQNQEGSDNNQDSGQNSNQNNTQDNDETTNSDEESDNTTEADTEDTEQNTSEDTTTESTSVNSNETVENSTETETEVAVEVETPEVETTEVDDSGDEVSLSGRILGFSGSSDMPGDDIKATRKGTKLTFSATGIDDLIDNDTSSISGTTDFNTTFGSSYTTFKSAANSLGTMTLSPSSNKYNVYSDNTGQVFVLYNDNGTASKEMIIVGKSGSSSSLSSSKVYRYDIFKELEIERTSLTSVITDTTKTKFNTTDLGSIYYNAYLKSSTYFDKKVFEKGASSFSAGSDTSMKHYENEYVYNGGVTNYYANSSILDIDILGSEAQALAINLHTQRDNQTTGSTDKYSDLLVSAFLNTSATTTATTSSTKSLTGYSSYLLVDNSSTPAFYHRSDENQTISLSVNQNTGAISGNIDSTGSAEYAKLKFSGTIGDKSSYYINDDMFGSLGSTDSASEAKMSNTTYSLTDIEESAMIAVPDGAYVNGAFKMFDSNDNPLTSDDDSSWGYWTADYGTETDVYVDPFSTWVAGVETSTSDITDAINAGTQKIFYGKVLGYVSVSSSGKMDRIDMNDSTNSVKLTFNFGDGVHNLDSDSYMKFKSIDSSGNVSSTWSMSMSSNNSSTATFTGSLSGTNQSGSFNGKLYGSGLKSVGGNFNASNSSTSDNAYGVFKATKE